MSVVALGAALVTVVVDGRVVAGSVAARLHDRIVVAPFDPYVRAIADRIERVGEGDRYVLVRGSRRIAARVGSRQVECDRMLGALPIAPYVRSGEVIIPLAAIARGLGASVSYDARSRTLAIVSATDVPLAQATPAPPAASPAGGRPTFSPTSAPVPAPTVTGIPQPRRTPIVIQPQPR